MSARNIVISANTAWYIYNFRKGTISALLEAGHKVTAIAPEDGYGDKLKEMGCDFQALYIDRGGTNPLNDLKTCLHYYRLYRHIKPDMVFNFTPKTNIYSTLAAKANKAKVVNNIAGLGTLFVSESLASKIARLLYRVSQPMADHIFFQNEEDMALFKEKSILSDSSSYSRLPGSGVNLQQFKVTQSPDDGISRFILVARMLKEKGVELYADAAKQIKAEYPNTEFNLLGFIDEANPSGISEKTLLGWQAEGHINYLGTTDDVHSVVGKMDCVVLPSYYREGVPKSLLEAGALGKAIITTDNVGCRETVDDGVNGFLCKTRSMESLRDSILKFLDLTDDQRYVMSTQSRAKMEEQFSEEIVIGYYLEKVSS